MKWPRADVRRVLKKLLQEAKLPQSSPAHGLAESNDWRSQPRRDMRNTFQYRFDEERVRAAGFPPWASVEYKTTIWAIRLCAACVATRKRCVSRFSLQSCGVAARSEHSQGAVVAASPVSFRDDGASAPFAWGFPRHLWRTLRPLYAPPCGSIWPDGAFRDLNLFQVTAPHQHNCFTAPHIVRLS